MENIETLIDIWFDNKMAVTLKQQYSSKILQSFLRSYLKNSRMNYRTDVNAEADWFLT